MTEETRRAFIGSALSAGVLAASRLPAGAASSEVTAGSAWRRGAKILHRISAGDDAYEWFGGVAWRSDGARVAVRRRVAPGSVIEARTGRIICELPGATAPLWSNGIRYVPGTDILALGGPSRGQPTPSPIALKIADGSTGQLLREVDGLIDVTRPANLPYPSQGFGAAPNAPGDKIAYSAPTGKLVIRPTQGTNDLEAFDPTTWQAEFWRINVRVYSPVFALHPTVPEAALALQDGGTAIIDLSTGDQKYAPEPLLRQGYDVRVTDYGYTPDGRILLASTRASPYGSYDGRLMAYDCRDGYRCVARLGGDFNYLSCIAVHPDSSIFVIVGKGVAYFCSLDDFGCFARMDLPSVSVQAAFSPDGSMLACSDEASRSLLLISP